MRRPRLQFSLCRLVFLLFPRFFVHLSLFVCLTFRSTFILLPSLSDHDIDSQRESDYVMTYIYADMCNSVEYREQRRARAHSRIQRRVTFPWPAYWTAVPRLEPWEHTTRRLIPHRYVRILLPSLLFSSLLFSSRRRPRALVPHISLSFLWTLPRRLSSRSLALSHPAGPLFPTLQWLLLPARALPSVPSLPLPSFSTRSCARCAHIETACLYAHICVCMCT